MRKTSDLSNKFILKIAFNENLNAFGYILGIDDYNDDGNIVDSCTGKNDCLVKIIAKTEINEKKTNITVKFEKNSENTVIQEIFITEVEVFARNFVKTRSIYYLKERFLVKDQVFFSFEGENLK